MRSRAKAPVWLWAALAAGTVLTVPLAAVHAQGGGGGGQSTSSDSAYIDGAIPRNQIRFRFDSAYDDTTPDRGEFFYSQYHEQLANGISATATVAPAASANSGGGGGSGRSPGGPSTFVNGGGKATVTKIGDQTFIYSPQANGLGAVETRIDYQDLDGYVEGVLIDRLSAFVELPVRFLNPDVNANTTGLADMNAGFKWAFWETDNQVGTFQLRTYLPTGAASRGLGTNHVSLEPAFLFHDQLAERLNFDAELRDLIPIGGTDFESNVIRYGVGVSYDAWRRGEMRLTPVGELVGWTLIGGKVTEQVAPNVFDVFSANGDTIVNLKAGARLWFNPTNDMYVGYGHALTGAAWYRDILRVEYRMAF